MKSNLVLLLLAFSISAQAEIKVSNADGWKLEPVKDDKMVQFVLPGAEYALVKESDKTDGMTITIRKVTKQSEETLGENKEAWMRSIFSAEKRKKIQTSPERQSIINVDGQVRFVGEIQFDSGAKVPLNEAIMGVTVGDDLYLAMYEHRGQVYRRNRKEALELLKKIKIEAVTKESAAKTE